MFLAEVEREGLAEFLKKEIGSSVAVVSRPGLVAFSPERGALEAFAPRARCRAQRVPRSPCFERIAEAQGSGAGLLMCADLDGGPPARLRYIVAEQKERRRSQSESRATIGFGGPRTGIAAGWPPPRPWGRSITSLRTPRLLAAFVVNEPGGHRGRGAGLPARRSARPSATQAAPASISARTWPPPGRRVRPGAGWPGLPGAFLEAGDRSLRSGPFPGHPPTTGGDPQPGAAKSGGKPLRTSQETVNGRVYYMIAGGRSEPAHRGSLHLRGWLPDRRALARAGEHALQVKSARARPSRAPPSSFP